MTRKIIDTKVIFKPTNTIIDHSQITNGFEIYKIDIVIKTSWKKPDANDSSTLVSTYSYQQAITLVRYDGDEDTEDQASTTVESGSASGSAGKAKEDLRRAYHHFIQNAGTRDQWNALTHNQKREYFQKMNN